VKFIAICFGNTCRSPMLEVILKEELKKAGTKDVEVLSAGLLEGSDGRPISVFSKVALEQLGYELEEHSSKHISNLSIEREDVLLVTSTDLLPKVREMYPENKIVLLNDPEGVPNPWEKPYEEYLACARVIQQEALKIV